MENNVNKPQRRYLKKDEHFEAIAYLAHMRQLLEAVSDARAMGEEPDPLFLTVALEELESVFELLTQPIMIDDDLINECIAHVKERFADVSIELINASPLASPDDDVPDLKIIPTPEPPPKDK